MATRSYSCKRLLEASFSVPSNPFIFTYYRSERDEKQPENGEKQGKAEVSRAILTYNN